MVRSPTREVRVQGSPWTGVGNSPWRGVGNSRWTGVGNSPWAGLRNSHRREVHNRRYTPWREVRTPHNLVHTHHSSVRKTRCIRCGRNHYSHRRRHDRRSFHRKDVQEDPVGRVAQWDPGDRVCRGIPPYRKVLSGRMVLACRVYHMVLACRLCRPHRTGRACHAGLALQDFRRDPGGLSNPGVLEGRVGR